MSDRHAGCTWLAERLVALVTVFTLFTPTAASAADAVDPRSRPAPAQQPQEIERELVALKSHYLGVIPGRPLPSLEEMIAAMDIGQASSAARYVREVVAQSDAALPLLHARLASPQVNPRAKLAVILALGAIGDPSSAAPILEAAKGGSPHLHFVAWQALWILPRTEEVMNYSLEVAADPKLGPARKKGAYVALALHREERGRPFGEALLASQDASERATGVFILGFLGADVRAPAAEILGMRDLTRGREQGPLLALAEIAGPDELRALVPGFRRSGERWQESLRRSTWRHAPPDDPGERTSLCLELTRGELPGYGQEGVRCLLKLGRHDLLLREVLSIKGARGAGVLGMLQREGWRMVVSDRDVRLEKHTRPAAMAP